MVLYRLFEILKTIEAEVFIGPIARSRFQDDGAKVFKGPIV